MSRKKSEDVRQSKQLAGERYLELLVETLQSMNNGKSVEELARKVNLTPAEFKLHHSELDHFEEMKEDFETYGHAVRLLQDRAFSRLNKKIETVLQVEKINKPSIKILQLLGTRHRKSIDWIPENFKASRAWAQRLRRRIVPTDFRNKRRPRKFRELLMWCRGELYDDNCISNAEAKKSYEEIYGHPPKTQKAWSHVSKLLRLQLRLKMKIVKKDTGKRCYFWVQDES